MRPKHQMIWFQVIGPIHLPDKGLPFCLLRQLQVAQEVLSCS